MKGKYKKRKWGFRPGHRPYKWRHYETDGEACTVTSGYKRFTSSEFQLVTAQTSDGEITLAADVDGNPSSIKLLRPPVTTQDQMDVDSAQLPQIEGNRIIDVQLMMDMWNSVINLHSQQFQMCMTPELKLHTQRKWALGWSCSVRCVKCEYESPLYKLYREAESNRPGPKPALVNQYLQSALLGQAVATKGARLMLSHLNVPAGCKSAMQRQSNSISKAVTDLNKRDMEEKTEQVIKTNQLKGADNPNEVGVSLDGRYNSVTFGSAKKPGLNASQGLCLAAETCTNKKWIIARVLQNKLCWIGAWLRGKGFDGIECPGNYAGCTANLDRHSGMSEYDMGMDIGNQLALQGVLVKYATTDGDGRSAHGIEDAMKALHPMWKVERLADPTHLARSQFRMCNSASFSTGMFPGRTKLMKTQQQKTLSQDIKARCSLIFKELMKLHKGDMVKITERLPAVLDSTTSCYSGDCSKCRLHSVVCRGDDNNNWWLRSVFLGVNRLHHLQMTSNDARLLLELLKLKLSTETVMSMRLQTSTQKNEGSHRAVNVSLPKYIHYGRNAEGRLDNVILTINNTAGEAVKKKVEHLGGTLCADVNRTLDQLSCEEKYQRSYKYQPEVKKRSLLLYGKRLKEHVDKSRKSDYRRGQLDPKVGQQSKGDNSLQDHLY